MTRLLALLVALPAAAQTWNLQENREGVRLETREVAGSSFEELRVTSESTATPDRLCEAIWGAGKRPLEPGFKVRQTLTETSDERWSYERISHAMAWDRDYTLHIKREITHDGGCRIVFETQNEKGPPPQRGAIRIPAIRGSWEISHLPQGGTQIVYVLYSEPGGRVPAFIARGGQRSSAIEWMRVILGRVQEPSEQHAKL